MKEFIIPIKKSQVEEIAPQQYERNFIIVAVIDCNIYILNEFLKYNHRFYKGEKQLLQVVAYSLYSRRIWAYKESMEELIAYILGQGHKVYQFDNQEEFFDWIKEIDFCYKKRD